MNYDSQTLSCTFKYINESGIQINGLSNINNSLSVHYLIYQIDNQLNGKFYIGQHKTANPLDDYMGSGTLICKAEQKYGLSAFSKTILFDFETYEEMSNKEAELVPTLSCYHYNPNCYNLISGGGNPMSGIDPRVFMTEDAIKEMSRKRSLALKNRKRKSSTFKKLSEGKRGDKNPMYHKPTEQMPHYNKKCMKNLQTGQYEYVDKNQIEEYQKKGYILEGSNKNTKKSKKACQLNSIVHLGRKYMIHPITKDRKNPLPKDFQMYLSLGYIFMRP